MEPRPSGASDHHHGWRGFGALLQRLLQGPRAAREAALCGVVGSAALEEAVRLEEAGLSENACTACL